MITTRLFKPLKKAAAQGKTNKDAPKLVPIRTFKQIKRAA